MEQRNIICSVCKSDRVITDQESGEVICSNCGLVISDNIQDSTDAMYDKSRNEEVEILLLVTIWDFPLL
jgi:transcription initiation factor TFIIIB Brf1 subunit/transcription initiation factor TFIIB